GHPPDPARAYQITSGKVQRSGPPNPVAPITYMGLGTLQLNGSGAVYQVLSTAFGTTTAVAATGAGAHAIHEGDGNKLQGSQGPVQVAGQGGNNQLTLTDALSPFGRTFKVGGGAVAVTPGYPVTYSQVQQVTIRGSKFGNTFQVLGTAPGTPVLLGGGG